jgi:hypothetical protein
VCGAHAAELLPLAILHYLRRFPRSVRNLLGHYCAAVDACHCYINTGAEPDLVFAQRREHRNIGHRRHYERLNKQAGR